MKEYIIIFKENTDVYMQFNSSIKEVIQIKINQIKLKKISSWLETDGNNVKI